MNRESPSAFLLFELLARRWAVPAAALSLKFNGPQSRLAAPLADGSVALIDCADPEPPESRITADDSGRRTIAPRRSDPRAATIVAARGPGPAEACRGPGDGFLVAYRDASLWRLHAEGSLAAIAPAGGAPLIAIDRCAATATTMIVAGGEVALRSDAGAVVRASAPAGVRAAALSPDGAVIAFGCADSLALASAAAPSEIVQRFATPGPVGRIDWRDDGAFLAAVCESGELALLDVRNNRFGCVGGFPAPPRSIAWSGPSNAIVASGAYRIAAWDLANPPFDDARAGALETGRAGMVAVEQVAAHPKRKLVAAAYANGQVVIAEPGRRDEMILKASGPTPAALAWSADGRMLAIAAPDAVSLVTLPEALFK